METSNEIIERLYSRDGPEGTVWKITKIVESFSLGFLHINDCFAYFSMSPHHFKFRPLSLSFPFLFHSPRYSFSTLLSIFTRFVPHYRVMTKRINFKLDYNDVTYKFGSELTGGKLFYALKDAVASIVQEFSYELFWNGQSLLLSVLFFFAFRNFSHGLQSQFVHSRWRLQNASGIMRRSQHCNWLLEIQADEVCFSERPAEYKSSLLSLQPQLHSMRSSNCFEHWCSSRSSKSQVCS